MRVSHLPLRVGPHFEIQGLLFPQMVSRPTENGHGCASLLWTLGPPSTCWVGAQSLPASNSIASPYNSHAGQEVLSPRDSPVLQPLHLNDSKCTKCTFPGLSFSWPLHPRVLFPVAAVPCTCLGATREPSSLWMSHSHHLPRVGCVQQVLTAVGANYSAAPHCPHFHIYY